MKVLAHRIRDTLARQADPMWVEKLLIAVFCFSFPFGTRLVLWHATGKFFPYNTVFLYATDILMGILVIFWLVGGKDLLKPFKNLAAAGIAAFIGVGAVSAAFSDSPMLGMATEIRIAFFAIFALFFAHRFWTGYRFPYFAAIFLDGVFQSALSWLQFFFQRDMGLRLLGEQALRADAAGIAKIEVSGIKLIRAYGTFPHPNVLAAFLVFAIFLSCYAYVKTARKDIPTNILWLGGITSMLSALFFTFSRSGWIAFAVGLGVIALRSLAGKTKMVLEEKKRAWALGIIVAAVAVFAALWFPQEIRSRGEVALRDQAVQMRLETTYWAAKMLDAHKFLGIGPGQFTSHIDQYAGALPESWMYQPAHNLYLLTASESGLLGLIALLFFLGFALRAWASHKNGAGDSLFRTACLAIFLSFLVLGLFDHYFLTLEQGLALFWISAALMLAAGKNREAA